MSERKTCHVSLFYVLPEEERDEITPEMRATWKNALLGEDQLDAVGERGNYFVDLTEEEIARANSPAIKNVEYAIPAETVRVHGDPEDVEVVAEARTFDLYAESVEPLGATRDFAFPEAKAMAYHRATGTEKNKGAGKGYIAWHLDTGVSKVMERMTPGGIVFRKDYTGSGTTEDRNGHGSMSCSLAVPLGASLAVCKVLGDDGSGSSVGITAAIRDAAKFVRENPKYRDKVVLTGSLGGSPGTRFKPYEDACKEAEEAGVLCLWSAGNDGAHAISPPANWKEDRASIAFVLETDRRASFSNHHASAGLATQGQSVLMIDKSGNLVRGNGTSFSLPLWTRHVLVGAWMRSASVFDMHRSTLTTARNSAESVDEEAHGVLDLWKAINKLQKPKKPSAKLFSKFQKND